MFFIVAFHLIFCQLELERREAEIKVKREEEEKKRLEEVLRARQEEERKRLEGEEMAQHKQVSEMLRSGYYSLTLTIECVNIKIITREGYNFWGNCRVCLLASVAQGSVF